MKGHNYGKCERCGKVHMNPFKGFHHTEEARRRISEGNKGKKRSFETRRKISKARKGWKPSLEFRKRLSEILKGRVSGRKGCNYGFCWKCRKIHVHPMKGKPPSEETKRKISLVLRGRIFSDEHRKKLSENSWRFKENIGKVRRYYRITEDIQFLPADFFEHKFAREVLIERGRYYPLVTRSRLPARGEWAKHNLNEENPIPVVI